MYGKTSAYVGNFGNQLVINFENFAREIHCQLITTVIFMSSRGVNKRQLESAARELTIIDHLESE